MLILKVRDRCLLFLFQLISVPVRRSFLRSFCIFILQYDMYLYDIGGMVLIISNCLFLTVLNILILKAGIYCFYFI